MKIIELLNQARKAKTYKREQILSMSPGPELDAIAANVILGWDDLKQPFFPSRDISAAFELVEKLSRGRVDNSFALEFHFERYYATFGEVPIRPCRAVMYKTAPEAITKAAILSMMEQSGGTGE